MSGRRRKAEPDEIRTKAFRHTYVTARLQTLDHGAPVAARTIAGEVGHASLAMIERTHGHLGTIRHRSEVVEYRAEQHVDTLKDRLPLITANIEQLAESQVVARP